MEITKIWQPYPAVYIEDFFPNTSLLRAAAESYNEVDDWVKYGGEDSGQVQWCNKLGREYITTPALVVMDYMVTNFNPNEIFFTAFEPKQANRFILYMDGIPSFMIKGMSAVTLAQGVVTLNHINVERKVKGKSTWQNMTMTLFDPITPSGAQAVMEWVRLHHESVTGRDGYSDFYKKDLTIDVLGPVGDIVSESILKGAFVVNTNFGEYNWDTVDQAVTLNVELSIDYAVLNF